jgi:hypothetical protein
MNTLLQALRARVVARAGHCIRTGMVALAMVAAVPAAVAAPINGVTSFGSGGNDQPIATGNGTATAYNARGTGWNIQTVLSTSATLSLYAGDLLVGTGGDGIYYQEANGYTETLSSFNVASDDDSLFDLNGFQYTTYTGGVQVTFQVIGYRKGAAVPGAAWNVSITDDTTAGTVNMTGVQAFQGIDEFRIVPTGMPTGYFGIDNINVQNVRPADTTPPTVVGVTSATANGTYKVGDTVSLQVVLSEPVNVVGMPQLTLETGTTDRVANFNNVNGSQINFSYTVQAGDTSTDLDYRSTEALSL